MATKREATEADDADTAVTTSELGLVLLAGAAVVLAAIVAARVAHGIGLPGLLLFLGLGLALEEAVLQLTHTELVTLTAPPDQVVITIPPDGLSAASARFCA